MIGRHYFRSLGRIIALGGIAVAMAANATTAAIAQQQQQTPRGWNYELKDGKRVPRTGNRVTNPDGSWREEHRQGNCVTVKEMTKNGEYKETRQCNPS